jgi:hypothetical protein
VVRVFRQKQNKAKTELTVCEEDRDSSPSYHRLLTQTGTPKRGVQMGLWQELYRDGLWGGVEWREDLKHKVTDLYPF